MKKIILLAMALIFVAGLSSCKKCATCTYQDPQRGTLTSEDVCQKGKAYTQTMEQYKNNGWTCTEK